MVEKVAGSFHRKNLKIFKCDKRGNNQSPTVAVAECEVNIKARVLELMTEMVTILIITVYAQLGIKLTESYWLICNKSATLQPRCLSYKRIIRMNFQTRGFCFSAGK